MLEHNVGSVNLDHTHCRAICDEIGERLGFILKPASPDMPPRLLYLLARLADLDNCALPRLESAPSIAPSAEDMADAIADFTADAA
jgi:hypothetical protein